MKTDINCMITHLWTDSFFKNHFLFGPPNVKTLIHTLYFQNTAAQDTLSIYICLLEVKKDTQLMGLINVRES